MTDSRRPSWFETSDVVPMFPSLVWKMQLLPQRRGPMDAAMLATIAELRRDLAAAEAGRGWQSPQDLHRHPAFADLAGCIEHASRGILRFLRSGYDAMEITACWANVLPPGAAHKAHSHPNNYLSGVYYLCTPPGADCINFHDPRAQTGVIRPPAVELTAENTDQVVVRVRNGTLLLFPAWLPHSVDSNASREERISISFNLMFSAYVENMSRPLW